MLSSTSCKDVIGHVPATGLAWAQLPPVPDAQGFAGSFAGVSGGALIVAGGANIVGDKWATQLNKQWYDSAFVLESPEAQWRTGFKLPQPLGYGVSITTPDGVVCIGGSDSTRHHAEVFRLSWQNGKLETTPLPSLPRPCANFCGAILNGIIYVAGGIETPTATNALKTFWSLDLSAANPKWVELEPWPGPGRMLATTGVLNGSFYLFAGTQLKTDANGKVVREYCRDAFAFTPGKGWRRLADLPTTLAAPPTPAVSDGRLLIFSGDDGSKASVPQTPQHPGFSRETLAYDADKDSWSVASVVPFSRATTTAVEWHGHVVIPMGEVRPRERTAEVWWAKLPAKGSP